MPTSTLKRSRLERRPAEHRMRRRYRALSGALIVVLHALLIFSIWSVIPPRTPEPAPQPVEVVMAPYLRPLEEPPPPPASPAATSAPSKPAGAAPKKSEPVKPPAPVKVRRAVRPERAPVTLAAAPAPAPATPVGLSDADVAGAATAGSASGGGGDGANGVGSCDMIGRLQAALRRDRRIQSAMAGAHLASGGRAVQVWNGEWVQSSGEEGLGLAGVRQAIMVEVAFAPEACRRKPMHGLVLISLQDGPGAARLVLGAGAWRWSDLLFARGARSPSRS